MRVLKKTIALILLLVLITACENDAVDTVFTEQTHNVSETITADEVWSRMDKLQDKIAKELESVSLPDPHLTKIPNPFIPKIEAHLEPSGSMTMTLFRAFSEILTNDYFWSPYNRVDWFETVPQRKIEAYSNTSSASVNDNYFTTRIDAKNSGPRGYIEIDLIGASADEPENCYNPRYYRITIKRNEGENNWVTVKDFESELTRHFTRDAFGGDVHLPYVSYTPARYTYYENQLHYEIIDNEQRDKWYHIAVSTYTDCPGEPVEPRVVNAYYYFQKFDPGF